MNKNVINIGTDSLFDRMKKVIFLLPILLLFCAGLWGCGSDKTAKVSESETEVTTKPVHAKETETKPVPAKETETESVPTEAFENGDYGDLPTFNGHAYEFIDNTISWTEARKYCDSVGGHLVTITSPEEQDFIENTFSGKQFWIGAYCTGAYGGDKYDWRWVTSEQWYYENFADGEPSNSGGEEWFGCTWKNMKWNDIRENDPGNRLAGFVCEYDDLIDLFETVGSGAMLSDPPEFEDFDSEEDWVTDLQESVEEDPYYKDLGDGRIAIQSHLRGVQIKYPDSYIAGEDGDALYVYDGDSMYVYARNITTAAESYKGDLSSFCAAEAEAQVVRDFTELFGAPTNKDGIKREGGDGKKRICVISGNMWNDNADIQFKSKVFISGKQNDFIVIYTAFWRWGDETSADHFKNVTVTSWGKGDMYE